MDHILPPAISISLIILGSLVGYFFGRYKIKTSKVSEAIESTTLYKPEIYLANETLHHLRKGLTAETAQQVVEIIKRIIPVDAVAITDTEQIIGFTGAGCKYHRLGRSIVTNITKEAILTGKVMIINQGEFNCSIQDCTCPLKAAVIMPLFCEEKVVGTLKLYQVENFFISDQLLALAKGIGQILSIQIELAEKEHQKQLAAKAKLEALQAQIRPHFLFNILNTIIHCSRSNPDQARDLLLELAKFFRKTLMVKKDFITLSEEIEYIKTYLNLEKARFGDKLFIKYDIEPQITDCLVPILSVQPLVENAVLHGISNNYHGGEIVITCKKKKHSLYIVVGDNGKGISKQNLNQVKIPNFGTNNGLGLSNIDQRLASIYGPKFRLKIRSKENQGTIVLIKIPIGGVSDEGSLCEVQ